MDFNAALSGEESCVLKYPEVMGPSCSRRFKMVGFSLSNNQSGTHITIIVFFFHFSVRPQYMYCNAICQILGMTKEGTLLYNR